MSGLSAFQPGWFTDGLLTWTSGQWNGEHVRVRRHVKADTSVTLNLMAGAGVPGVGDTFSVVAGCEKSFATCRTRFGNALNFRGFPHLPGNDLAYSYATDGGNFDGRAVVP